MKSVKNVLPHYLHLSRNFLIGDRVVYLGCDLKAVSGIYLGRYHTQEKVILRVKDKNE
ncbi:MAG: hypothetical protein JSV04_14480 [Candidatus Heimdallarchaeota archaeon]|nr:MAG: hypothetical protein JSV04_14480 [Candidatus Heimdallarchaeota archaeon]